MLIYTNMRNIIILLLLAAQAQAATITLHGGSTAASAIQLYNQSFNSVASPGDVVMLKGHYTLINLRQAHGVIFQVDSGMRVGSNTNNSYGILIEGDGWTFNGTDTLTTCVWNDNRIQTNNFIVGNSRNFTIRNIKLRRAQAAIFGNPTTGGNMGSPLIENFSISETAVLDGVTSEGIYLGPTSLGDTSQVYWQNAIIRNGTMYNLAGDGIQVALYRNVRISSIRIYNYGQNNLTNQRAGLVIGGSSSGTVDSVVINGGTGTYMQFFGYGNLLVKNCTFSNGANTTNAGESGGPDGVYIQRNGNASFSINARFENATIAQARRNAIRNVNAASVQLCNVTMTSTQANTSGANFAVVNDCNETPPPPDPAPIVKPGNRPQKVKPGRVIRLRG